MGIITIAVIFALLTIIIFIEEDYSPRFGYTKEGWTVIWFGPPSNRRYIRIW